MMEIAMAVQVAGAAFKGIMGALEQGREAGDLIGYYAKFFEAKDAITDQGINSNSQSMVKKLLSGGSVEAEALRVTQAKHQVMEMEKQLREYLVYTGQSQFYEDMMQERRNIRLQRSLALKRRAEKKAFMIDMIALVVAVMASVFIIGFTVALISSGAK